MPVVPTDELRGFVVDLLQRVGAPDDIAETVADSLIGADLAGHGSHGLLKLPSYVRDVERGRLSPPARPRVLVDTPAIVTVDGEGGFGHLAAQFAADLAIERAARSGLAAVSVSHTHHTGRLGGWSERIARAGLIGMLMGGEGQEPYKVAPHGGRSGALATNPVTWAVPRGADRPPVLLDYATSVVSIGKLQIARETGDPVPSGILLDAAGHPSDEVDDFFGGGFLLPFGGHKGYALAVIAELLAVGLSAGERFNGVKRSSCLFVLAIDPGVFRPADEWSGFVESTLRRLRSVAPTDSGAEVLIPGDPEVRARSRASGVTVTDGTWRGLEAVAGQLGVPPGDIPVPRPTGGSG